MSILIVDDEKDMLRILKTYFINEGYKVWTAENGQDAIDILDKESVKLSVVDWMMPIVDGIDLCRYIKSISDTKVIMLTAKNTNDDELKALKHGADDYIRKPFDPRVLMIRAKKLIQEDETLNIRDIVINTRAKKVYKAGKDINATKKEYKLIKVLSDAKGDILTRVRLLDLVWGYDYQGDERTLDTHIRRLRRKIGENVIRTHRGLGYSLEE